jgi:hypothetical protein
MRQGHVDNRGIKHLERGAKHHRERNQPFVRWLLAFRFGSADWSSGCHEVKSLTMNNLKL